MVNSLLKKENRPLCMFGWVPVTENFGGSICYTFLRACIPTTICVSGIFRCQSKKITRYLCTRKKRQEAVSQKRMVDGLTLSCWPFCQGLDGVKLLDHTSRQRKLRPIVYWLRQDCFWTFLVHKNCRVFHFTHCRCTYLLS